jgi:AraC-like DNA-binding protein
MRDWDLLAMMAIYIVVHFSTSIISYSMTSLLRAEKYRWLNLFIPGLFMSAVIAFLLVDSYDSYDKRYFWFMCGAALLAFMIQSTRYIIHFAKVYKKSLKEIEEYYDEDESHRLKWVRFCYIIAMVTNLFILVYGVLYAFLDCRLLLAQLYTAWYLVYMLYLTSNFISFIGSHKLILDAVARPALSNAFSRTTEAERIRKKAQEEELNVDREFHKLDKALQQWVEQKLYCEYAKSREETAKELNTTKEMLYHYFQVKMGIDFKTWRTQLRIEEAKRLLLENKDVSTNIIGEAAGFSDRSNFHRQFVRFVGCSPKQWRDSNGRP